MSLPQPTPDAPDVAWLSLSEGMLGLGWLASLVICILLVVGLIALGRLVLGLCHFRKNTPAVQSTLGAHARTASGSSTDPHA